MISLHVLHVIDSMGRGGAERQLLQLTRHLAACGVRQSLVQLYREDALLSELPSSVHAVRLGLPHRITSLPLAIARVRRAVGDLRPDVVSTQLVASDIAGRIAARGLALPVVTTWQNTTYAPSAPLMSRPRTAFPMRALRALDRATAGVASRFIAVSETVRESYTSALRVPPSRTVVIPNSIDLARFSGPPPPRATTDSLRIVHVGRHVPQKGLSTLLDAVGLLPPHLRFEIHLFGAGPLTPSLREHARRLAVEDRVVFRGAVTDVASHLRSADVFVFPSLHEGLALALLEAYAAGLAVVASDIAPNREIDPQGRATLHVPPSEPAALAAALQRVIEDATLRSRLRDRAPDVLGPFRIERVGDRFLEVLRDVAS